MQARHLVLTGALVAVLTGSDAAQATQSAPDVHVVRQPRGDVLVVLPDPPASYIAPYAAPYAGWTYKPVRAGQRLMPGFYAERYAVAAPRGRERAGKYRRWIRYGDDLLLVNERDGRIVRVLPGGYRSARGA